MVNKQREVSSNRLKEDLSLGVMIIRSSSGHSRMKMENYQIELTLANIKTGLGMWLGAVILA